MEPQISFTLTCTPCEQSNNRQIFLTSFIKYSFLNKKHRNSKCKTSKHLIIPHDSTDSGITIHAIKQVISKGKIPDTRQIKTHTSLRSFGSIEYTSPAPPQIPAIILFLCERYSFFIISSFLILISFLTKNNNSSEQIGKVYNLHLLH